jgi:hypothetical protein
MQPRICQAGPLAAASTTNIALAQTAPATGVLALNGSTTTAVANNICLSQSGVAATPLLINGSLGVAQYVNPSMGVTGAKVAYLPNSYGEQSITTANSKAISPDIGRSVYITSAGNDSGITFTIVGIKNRSQPTLVSTEVVTGSNASVVSSTNTYSEIISITPSGNTASTVTVGAAGFGLLDTARRVIFTSSGTDTGLTITIIGRDWSGASITETVTGGSSGSPASTVLDYLAVAKVSVSGATAGTMSVGTNGVCGSPWINLDTWAEGPVSGQLAATGTVNFTVQTSSDDPNSYGNPVSRSSVTWDSNYAGVIGATASGSFALAAAPVWMRVLLNSETGTTANVRMTVNQLGAVPL